MDALFIASETDTGVKPGYVFRLGAELGNGYYREGLISAEAAAAIDAEDAHHEPADATADGGKSRKQRMKELRDAKARQLQEERLQDEQKRAQKIRGKVEKEAAEVTAADLSALTPEQKRELAAIRLKELEAKLALENAVPGKSAEQLLAESAVAEFEDFYVTFTAERWGMRARLSGGPVIITAVAPDSEGGRNGVRLGDVIYAVNDINVETDRAAALPFIRTGGPATVHFKRLKGTAPIMAGIEGGATNVVKGDGLSHSDNAKLQAMLGQAKAKDTVTYAGQKDVTEVITDDAFHARSTLVFANCQDCTYAVQAMSTKVFIQGCKNVVVTITAKVVTGTIEVYKCENLTLNMHTRCGTVQLDMTRGVTLNFAKEEHFYDSTDVEGKKKNTSMIVWAGCHDLAVAVQDQGHRLTTTFEDMKKEYQDLVEERSQFRIRLQKNVAGDVVFCQEKIIRLDNGFFATQAEKTEFDTRQEVNLATMAKSMGLNIQPAKQKGPKCGPNERCPMGSGKKYKRCCNRPDGICTGKPDDADW